MMSQVRLMGLTFAILLLLVACSDGGLGTNDSKPNENGSGEGKGQEQVTEQVQPNKGPVEINLVTPDATISPEYMEILNNKFPNYKITHINQDTKGNGIPELLTVGTPIDIIGRAAAGFPADVLDFNLQYDMTDYIKQYNIKMEDFEPQIVNYIQTISDGKMYGIPGGSALNHIIFYNKTLFDQAGEDYPKDGMMWPEMMELAARMTRKEGDRQIFGFTGHTGIMVSYNQLGLSVADPATHKPTINTDERWKTFFQTLFSNTILNEAYKAEGVAFSGSTDRLLSGKTAMLLFNANIGVMNADLQAEKIEWDMVALPTFAEAPRMGSPMNSTVWGLTSITRNREAAMEVISYLISDENLGNFSRQGYLVPKITDGIIKSFASEAKPADKNWSAIIYNDYAPFSLQVPYSSKIRDVYAKYIGQFVLGKVDMNTAFRQAEEEAQQIITQYLNQ